MYQSVAVADHFIVNCILQVIKARILLDRSMAMPASFIPIHELANEIHIINAFCREAEVQISSQKKIVLPDTLFKSAPFSEWFLYL